MHDLILNGYDPHAGADDYYYDDAAAQRVINFVETQLTHVKGALARRPFVLWPHERTFVRNLFGWKCRDTHHRRYLQSTVFLPRGNSKSLLAAACSWWMTCCDGEQGCESYLAGPTRETAGIVFDILRIQRLQNPGLRNKTGCNPGRKRLRYDRTNSFLQGLAAEASGSHGQNAHFICVDEVHCLEGQRGREFFHTLETGLGKRKQPLMLCISTAGYDRTTIAWDLWDYAQRVRKKPQTDLRLLPMLYHADPADPWDAEDTWRKANPKFGAGVEPGYLRKECNKAQQMPSFQNEFKRLYLNVWTEQFQKFLSSADYEALPRHDLETTGVYSVAALDTSSTSDLSAFCVFWPSLNYLRCWFWIPAETERDRSLLDGVDYSGWKSEMEKRSEADKINITRSKRIDREQIVDKVAALCKQHKVMACAFDPWEGKLGLPADLVKRGVRMVEYRQNFQDMSAPTKEFEKLIAERKLNVGQNPCFDWCCHNLEIQPHHSGAIRPVRPADHTKRVDGAIAAIMSIGISKSVQPARMIG